MTRFGALVVVLMVGLYELSELGIWNVYSDPGLIVLPAFAEWLAPRLRSVSPNTSDARRRKVCKPYPSPHNSTRQLYSMAASKLLWLRPDFHVLYSLSIPSAIRSSVIAVKYVIASASLFKRELASPAIN